MEEALFVGRILRAIDVKEDHWIWKGPLNRNGYGYLEVRERGRRRKRMAHIAMWEIYHGSVPKRKLLDHTCRIRRCVSPSHLEPVTPRVNTLRGEGPTAVLAKKTHCLRGHPFDRKNTRRRRDGKGRRICRSCERLRQKKGRMKPSCARP